MLSWFGVPAQPASNLGRIHIRAAKLVFKPLRNSIAYQLNKLKGKRKGTLFKCLVVLALERQLGTLQTQINSNQMLVLVEQFIILLHQETVSGNLH